MFVVMVRVDVKNRRMSVTISGGANGGGFTLVGLKKWKSFWSVVLGCRFWDVSVSRCKKTVEFMGYCSLMFLM